METREKYWFEESWPHDYFMTMCRKGSLEEALVKLVARNLENDQEVTKQLIANPILL